MKGSWLISIILAIACILLSQTACQEAQKSTDKDDSLVVAPEKAATAPDKPDPNAPAPKIKFEKLVHNFGKIAPKSRNTCKFKFKNIGDALLKITKVKWGCSCTVPKLKKKEYAPGESGVMEVTYKAKQNSGPVTQRGTVITNDPVTPKVSLAIKAKVVERVKVMPKKLNLLLKEQEVPPKITLTSLDGKPFSIKSVKSSANAIAAEFDPSVEATEITVPLTINKDVLQRVTNGVVEIFLTHPGCKSVTIPYAALPQFKINPPVIILFDVEPGKAIVRKNVSILNNYEEEFEIESTSSKEGITKVLDKKKISPGYNLTLEITPPDLSTSKRFSDEFSIQVRDGESLKIKVQGFYAKKRKTGAK